MDGERRSTGKSRSRIGCALALVLGSVAAILVARNWSSISGAVQRTTRSMSELVTLQAWLREHYRAPELTTEVRWEGGIDGSILSIDVVNAPFLADLEFGTQRSLDAAFHVAIHARNELPADVLYDHYEVILTRHGEGLIAMKQWHTYRFEAADLPPR